MSLQVLDFKPWHFVALETMVAVSTAQRDDTMIALYKSRRLPPPSQGAKRRRQWVERALQDAASIMRRMQEKQEQLDMLEQGNDQDEDEDE